jgi:hypothetical protein
LHGREIIGTKTIHINGSLRLCMYSEGAGATEPDAPQAWIGRMTHLAASFAENAHPRVTASLRPAPMSRVRSHAASHAACSAVSTIYSDVAIFLETRLTSFHYSVIGSDVRIGLAPEIAGCHVLNAARSASSSRGDYAAARPPAADKERFDQTRPGYDFEPAEERLMRMRTLSLATWTSISRSRQSE